MDESSGAQIHQDGQSRFNWMLISAFGAVLILISSAALSKLWALAESQSDMRGDIKVILTNQSYQGANITNLELGQKELNERINALERKAKQ